MCIYYKITILYLLKILYRIVIMKAINNKEKTVAERFEELIEAKRNGLF